MRTTRLYHPEKLQCGNTIQLSKATSNHLIKVLRTKAQSDIILFNGDGYDYSCTTLDINARKTSITVNTKKELNNESNIKITLLQGLSRLDRMETTIQKAVELGAHKIIPVICQRSNTKLTKDKQIKKLEHWRKVVISACEQSGRGFIPEVTEVTQLNLIHTLSVNNAIQLTLNPEADASLKNININQKENIFEIFIGPEGGLNKEETAYLESKNFKDIRFGPRILRTETAGPAVISAIQTLWGDF